MKQHARVVVIGGGVVGCSVLYHLAKAGWNDVLLIERSELTSGSSWHAAGGFHTLNGDPNVAKLQAYTVQLYQELEELSGQSCGLHLTGGVMMADTPERMDFLRLAHAKGRYLGMETELITPSEAKAMFPLMDESNFVGALWDPVEGHLDPSGTTHAYAKAARKLGAEIVLRNRVVELTQEADGTWNVVTEKGTVKAEHVVNAGGLWAREVGRMVGLELPVLAMEHMYLLTEEMPEVIEFNRRPAARLVGVIDFKGEIYTRQERNGILLGTYEKACKPWSPVNDALGFRPRTAAARPRPHRAVAGGRLPPFPGDRERRHQADHQRPLHLRPRRQPAGRPGAGADQLTGRACAVMAGFSQGGGVGLALSNWMVHGDPGADIWGMDVARYGEWATLRYTNAKVRENYSRRFSIRFPNEELPAARPQQTTPLYDVMLRDNHAVMGDSWGLETPLWFAPEGGRGASTSRRSTAPTISPISGNEVRRTRERVGVTEIANFAKYEVTGPGAEAWLDHLMTNTMPKTGPHRADADAERRTASSSATSPSPRLGDERLHDLGLDRGAALPHALVREAPAQGRLGQRAPLRHQPGRPVDCRAESREVLEKLDRRRCLQRRLPLHGLPRDGCRRRALHGQPASPIPATSATRSGCRRPTSAGSTTAIKAAGAEFGIVDFGMRALLSMRLEKNFPTWFRELRPIYGPFEGGPGPLRQARQDTTSSAARRRPNASTPKGPKLSRVSFVIDAEDADVMGDEPIWARVGDTDYGTSSSPARLRRAALRTGRHRNWPQSRYRHRARRRLARRRLGHLRRLCPLRRSVDGAGLCAGRTGGAHGDTACSRSRSSASAGLRAFLAEPPFDPAGERMRG